MPRLTPTRIVTLVVLAITLFFYLGFDADRNIGEQLEEYGSPWESADTDEGGLDFAKDGLVHGWDAAHAMLRDKTVSKRRKRSLVELVKRHPIEVLMEQAEEQWHAILAR